MNTSCRDLAGRPPFRSWPGSSATCRSGSGKSGEGLALLIPLATGDRLVPAFFLAMAWLRVAIPQSCGWTSRWPPGRDLGGPQAQDRTANSRSSQSTPPPEATKRSGEMGIVVDRRMDLIRIRQRDAPGSVSPPLTSSQAHSLVPKAVRSKPYPVQAKIPKGNLKSVLWTNFLQSLADAKQDPGLASPCFQTVKSL